MRGLQAAVIFMGVLIVAGVAVIGVTIARRLNAPAPAAVAMVLDEPAGTHMVSVTQAGDRLAVLLQGGGVDRVVLVDPRSGTAAGRISLAR
jgi:hypothetical protein